jgi:mRNA interferase MazF
MSTKGKIVLVPFPFDDMVNTKVRPALCLTNETSIHNHVIIAFISSQVPQVINSSDIKINEQDTDFVQTGLKQNSLLVLHKLVTISTNIILKELGKLPLQYQNQINNNLKSIFNI